MTTSSTTIRFCIHYAPRLVVDEGGRAHRYEDTSLHSALTGTQAGRPLPQSIWERARVPEFLERDRQHNAMDLTLQSESSETSWHCSLHARPHRRVSLDAGSAITGDNSCRSVVQRRIVDASVVPRRTTELRFYWSSTGACSLSFSWIWVSTAYALFDQCYQVDGESHEQHRTLRYTAHQTDRCWLQRPSANKFWLVALLIRKPSTGDVFSAEGHLRAF